VLLLDPGSEIRDGKKSGSGINILRNTGYFGTLTYWFAYWWKKSSALSKTFEKQNVYLKADEELALLRDDG
jgi:hypothetical protein